MRQYLINLIASFCAISFGIVISVLAAFATTGLDNMGLALKERLLWSMPFILVVMPFATQLMVRRLGDEVLSWTIACGFVVPLIVLIALLAALPLGFAQHLELTIQQALFFDGAFFATVWVVATVVVPSCASGGFVLFYARKWAERLIK